MIIKNYHKMKIDYIKKIQTFDVHESALFNVYTITYLNHSETIDKWFNRLLNISSWDGQCQQSLFPQLTAFKVSRLDTNWLLVLGWFELISVYLTNNGQLECWCSVSAWITYRSSPNDSSMWWWTHWVTHFVSWTKLGKIFFFIFWQLLISLFFVYGPWMIKT